MAKQQKLCYRCLDGNHHGVTTTCPRSRICGIKGCGDPHNRLLHQDRSEPDQNCIEQKLAAIQRMLDQLVWIKLNRKFQRQ